LLKQLQHPYPALAEGQSCISRCNQNQKERENERETGRLQPSRHIKTALHMQSAATGQAQVQIGLYDAGKSISYYGGLLRAFLHLNMMVPVAAEDWFSRIKENSTSAGVGEFPAGHSAV
jgi:hypothetical protein